MLALAKRLFAQGQSHPGARWDLQAEVLGEEILGRTLGIVGLGHSGRELVRLAAPFSMTVLAYSPHADPAEARGNGRRMVSTNCFAGPIMSASMCGRGPRRIDG